MIPRVFRVEHGHWSWWVIADGRGVMSSLPGEPRASLLARWGEVYGVHPGGVLDHPDPITPNQVGDALDLVRVSSLALGREGGAA